MIYLDYAATAPLKREVFDAMLPYLGPKFGNPDSTHAFGREAAYAVTVARDKVAEILGVSAQEIYFTSGGTESDNWAVRNLGGKSALLSPIEHRAALSAAELREGGFRLSPVGRDGIVGAEQIESFLDDNTGLVCVMSVNNETGAIQPIKEISQICGRRKIPLFCDCVQAALSQDLKALCAQADAISLSGHKLGAMKGVGALMVKKGIPLRPLIAGGEQERGLRGGTLNVAAIVGFAKALELAQQGREEFCARTQRLSELFREKIFSALHDDVRQDGEVRAPNLLHLTFRCAGRSFLQSLDLNGVAASGGAACSAQSELPSHVLLAMGRTEEEALRGVRFSFGAETTEEEVLRAAQTVIRLLR